jgi:hypothetical protein
VLEVKVAEYVPFLFALTGPNVPRPLAMENATV